MKKYKTFEMLLNTISAIDSFAACQKASDDVTQSFDHDKITYTDYVTLMELVHKSAAYF